MQSTPCAGYDGSGRTHVPYDREVLVEVIFAKFRRTCGPVEKSDQNVYKFD